MSKGVGGGGSRGQQDPVTQEESHAEELARIITRSDLECHMTLFTFQRDYPGCHATAIPEAPLKVTICNSQDHPCLMYFRNRNSAFFVGQTPGQMEAARVNKRNKVLVPMWLPTLWGLQFRQWEIH